MGEAPLVALRIPNARCKVVPEGWWRGKTEYGGRGRGGAAEKVFGKGPVEVTTGGADQGMNVIGARVWAMVCTVARGGVWSTDDTFARIPAIFRGGGAIDL